MVFFLKKLKRGQAFPNLPKTAIRQITSETFSRQITGKLLDLCYTSASSQIASLPLMATAIVGRDEAALIYARPAADSLTGAISYRIESAEIYRGFLHPKNVFLANDAILEFSEAELLAKIDSGAIGEGSVFLGGSVVGENFSCGRNFLAGPECRLFGGVVGDDVTFVKGVWIGEDVKIGSGVIVGATTSIAGRSAIGNLALDSGASSQIIIGESCSIDSCTIEEGTILGAHCLVDGNPHFSGIIPDGALISGGKEGFTIIPY